jgi:hypothetical protein
MVKMVDRTRRERAGYTLSSHVFHDEVGAADSGCYRGLIDLNASIEWQTAGDFTLDVSQASNAR